MRENKTYLLFAVVTLLFPVTANAADNPSVHFGDLRSDDIKVFSKTYQDCVANMHTYDDAQKCFEAEMTMLDKELQLTYQSLIDKHNLKLPTENQSSSDQAEGSADKIKVMKYQIWQLQQSQTLWSQYKDANCNYYYYESYGDSADTLTLAKDRCLMSMTLDRVNELKKILSRLPSPSSSPSSSPEEHK